MEKKGLCITCVYDENCAFPRIFPVWQCEEFIVCETKPVKTRKPKPKKK